ncbi:MAG: ATP-binding protein, partial [Acidimicrobiales bacterium]
TFVEVLDLNNVTEPGDRCPAYEPGETSFSPKLPAIIRGFRVTSSDLKKELVTYFTANATVPGGPVFRVRASKLEGGGVLIVAQPIDEIMSILNRLLLLEIYVTGAALVGAVLLGLWFVRVGLRPLRDVVQTAEVISGGDLMQRVPGANDRTEVGLVATALNVMMERIETSFVELQSSENRLRNFVSDASHELRTPIAAVSAYAQLFKRGAETHTEDLPRVFEGIERETNRMARLVDDLLLLARFDEPRTTDFEPVELVGLAAEAIETSRTVGPEWPLTLVAAGPVEVMGDWSALRQVVDNLLSNIRAHTPAGTPATVRVGVVGEDALIEVIDAGPGIDEEKAASLFERFTRADPSRSRQTGGVGLGLAIVTAILRMHGGRADVHAGREGQGAIFRVYIPLLVQDPSSEER